MSEIKPDDMPNHIYPHSVNGEVSYDALADDVSNHPNAYHPHLRRHIGTFLENHGYLRDAILQSEEDRLHRQETAELRRLTAEEIREQLDARGSAKFGTYQANKFIDHYGVFEFDRYANRFTDLDEKVFARLSDADRVFTIIDNIHLFPSRILNEIVEHVVKSNAQYVLLKIFDTLPTDAQDVIRKNHEYIDSKVLHAHIDKFPEVNQTDLFYNLINKGYSASTLLDLCEGLTRIDRTLLFDRLSEDKAYDCIVELRSFFGDEMIEKLDEKIGQLEKNILLLKYDLPLAEGTSINELLISLIDREHISVAFHAINEYGNIDEKIFEKLIKIGCWEVFDHLDCFILHDKQFLLRCALRVNSWTLSKVIDFGGFSDEDARFLIREGYADNVLSRLNSFSDLSDSTVEDLCESCSASMLCQSRLMAERGGALYLYRLVQDGYILGEDELNNAESVKALLGKLEDAGKLYLLAKSIDHLEIDIAERVVDSALLHGVTRRSLLARAPHLGGNLQDIILKKINELDMPDITADLLDFKFSNIAVTNDTADRLMKSGHVAAVLKHIDIFPDIDTEAVMSLCFSQGEYTTFIQHLSFITKLSNGEIDILIQRGFSVKLLENGRLIDTQKSKEAVHDLIKRGQLTSVPEHAYRYIDGFMLVDAAREYVNESAETFQQFRDIVLGLSPVKQPNDMRTAAKIFGNSFNQKCLCVVHSMLDDHTSVPDSVSDLGIWEPGIKGLEQLHTKIADFVSRLHDIDLSQDIEDKITSNPLYFEAFKSVIKYDTSEHLWTKSDTSLRDRISDALSAIRNDDFVPLQKDYVKSDTYTIPTLSDLRERDEWTPDVRERYSILYDHITNALGANKDSVPLKKLFQDLSEKASVVMSKIDYDIESVEKDLKLQGVEPEVRLTRKLENLYRKRDELASHIKSVNEGNKHQKRFILNDPEAFTGAFSTLYPYEELHDTMRQIVFTWALRKNRYSSNKLSTIAATPTLDSISKVHDFVDHIVNDKIYGDLFVGSKKKKVASEFRKLCSTRALEEAMLRKQERAIKKDQEELQFIPTRGLLLEFSGDIADTCWTDKYASIASHMPNMTAIIMKRNPGKPTERLVGGAFLIETIDPQTGKGVLVLRGVNPIENYINKISVEEFYNAITDYTKQIAAKRGMKPAIVIDDHSGGSSSNRPVLFSYHESLVSGTGGTKPLKKICARKKDTDFNDYDITRDTYAIV